MLRLEIILKLTLRESEPTLPGGPIPSTMLSSRARFDALYVKVRVALCGGKRRTLAARKASLAKSLNSIAIRNLLTKDTPPPCSFSHLSVAL